MTYTTVHLDHAKARKVLELALAKANRLKEPTSKYKAEILKVISGSHLTYRYILVTNLLAKATDSSVNPLALQVGADFNGAFDSRSLCHKVFVPFERDSLGGKLGRSNEPYLNKPARHKALDTDNAVRRGNDRELLEICIYVLSKCTQAEAKAGLVDALLIALQRPSISDSVAIVGGSDTSAHGALDQFASRLLATSNEGENCALLTGIAFSLLSHSLVSTFDIRVHPVNQSGASSREVLDVDVYLNAELRYTAEVKDKHYSREDVDHAANKVKQAGYAGMFFLEGPNARTELTDQDVSEIAQEHGLRISVVPVKAFFVTALGLCAAEINMTEMWEMVVKISHEARFRQTTIDLIKQVATEVGIIE